MSSIDDLQAALDATRTPSRRPDIARRTGTGIAMGLGAVLVVLGLSGLTGFGRATPPGPAGDLTVQPVLATATGSTTPGEAPPATPGEPATAGPVTSVLVTGGSVTGGSVTGVPVTGEPVPTGADAESATTTAYAPSPPSGTTAPPPAPADVPTGTLTPPPGGIGGGFGIPAGGGSSIGNGVPVSATGRYAFSMICTGAWADHAVQVTFQAMTPGAEPVPGDPVGTFDCRQAQFEAQVSVDAVTTGRLQRAGTMALMTFTVVRRAPDGGGYVPIGPVLADLSVTFGDIRTR